MHDACVARAIERFNERHPDTSGDACVNWTGPISRKKGYGLVSVSAGGRSTTFGAHRISYLMANGELPERGWMVCHSCDNPLCVNPSHLWAGTASDNMRDCSAKHRHHNSKKAQCVQGHPFTEENTRIDKQGRRVCRECKRIRAQRDLPKWRRNARERREDRTKEAA